MTNLIMMKITNPTKYKSDAVIKERTAQDIWVNDQNRIESLIEKDFKF